MGLVDRLVGWLQRRWQAAHSAAHRLLTRLIHVGRRVSRQVADQVAVIRERHVQRLADDPDYTRTVTSGAAAVVATVVTHPVIVAVVTAGLTAMLTRLHGSTRSRQTYADRGEYGLADDYDPDRAWQPARPGRPAWEIFRD